MIWAILYVAGFLVSWIPLARVMHRADPPYDAEDEFFLVAFAGLAALMWPLTGSVALVRHIAFNSNRQEKK